MARAPQDSRDEAAQTPAETTPRVVNAAPAQIWTSILLGDSPTDGWLLDAMLLSIDEDETVH